jgi:hypothetical protein
VTPEFAARLSAEDLNDIAVGDIPLGTVQAFEAVAIAREAEDLREHFEERAGILEFDACLPRADAEAEAARIVATYARNHRGSISPFLQQVRQCLIRVGADCAVPCAVRGGQVASGDLICWGRFGGGLT